MTARKFRRIRKMVERFTNYEITESHGLFGDFTRKDCVKHIVRADSHILALERYFKWYERKNGFKHGWYTKYPVEMTYLWGRFQVKSENGKRLYFS